MILTKDIIFTQINWLFGIFYETNSYIYQSSKVHFLCMSFYKLENLLQTSLRKVWEGYAYQKAENIHKHEHDKKHVMKQQQKTTTHR